MAAPLIPALVTAGAGFLGNAFDSFLGARTSRRNTDRTIAAQKEMADMAYQRQVEMWHKQNEYNSPEEQMKRFGAAGLNPHLIYGQGNPGNASAPPAYQAPNLQYKYTAPAYGSAIASVLPTLMSVGTWMQNMRLTENKIQQGDQLVEFLESKYPHEIRRFNQVESLFPYQRQIEGTKAQQSWAQLDRLLQENRHLFGQDGDGGMRLLQRILAGEQGRKVGLEADWLSPTRIFGMVNSVVGRFLSPGRSISNVSRQARTGTAKRVKTFYQNGKRRSQVVDY